MKKLVLATIICLLLVCPVASFSCEKGAKLYYAVYTFWPDQTSYKQGWGAFCLKESPFTEKGMLMFIKILQDSLKSDYVYVLNVWELSSPISAQDKKLIDPRF